MIPQGGVGKGGNNQGGVGQARIPWLRYEDSDDDDENADDDDDDDEEEDSDETEQEEPVVSRVALTIVCDVTQEEVTFGCVHKQPAQLLVVCRPFLTGCCDSSGWYHKRGEVYDLCTDSGGYICHPNSSICRCFWSHV